MHHFTLLIGSVAYNISEVLAFEAHLKHILFCKMESVLYIIHNFWSRSRCKSKDRYLGNHFPDFGYLQVRRAEIVAPLADTMGFIYCDETYMDVFELGLKEF